MPHHPVRLRSSRNPVNAVCLRTLGSQFWSRFATQRGGAAFRQAPSPQASGSKSLTRALKPTLFASNSAIRKGRRFVLYLPLETL